MCELTQVALNERFYERVFPVVLDDADFHHPVRRMELLKYWKDQTDDLNKKARDLELNIDEIGEFLPEYLDCKAIWENSAKLSAFMKNMNTLTPQIHREEGFRALVTAVCRVVHQS